MSALGALASLEHGVRGVGQAVARLSDASRVQQRAVAVEPDASPGRPGCASTSPSTTR